MTIRDFLGSDHDCNAITQSSRNVFIIFINNASIYWFCKKQTSIDTSSFGSEFVVMKQCCEYILCLQYKLRMMGIIINKQLFAFGYNQSMFF